MFTVYTGEIDFVLLVRPIRPANDPNRWNIHQQQQRKMRIITRPSATAHIHHRHSDATCDRTHNIIHIFTHAAALSARESKSEREWKRTWRSQYTSHSNSENGHRRAFSRISLFISFIFFCSRLLLVFVSSVSFRFSVCIYSNVCTASHVQWRQTDLFFTFCVLFAPFKLRQPQCRINRTHRGVVEPLSVCVCA